MNNIIYLLIMAPCSALFSIIGIYAFFRKKPMWFWSMPTVEEEGISDIPAYNRANGIMWIVFSIPLWLSAFLGSRHAIISLILIILSCVIGLPLLMIVYKRIYAKYKS